MARFFPTSVLDSMLCCETRVESVDADPFIRTIDLVGKFKNIIRKARLAENQDFDREFNGVKQEQWSSRPPKIRFVMLPKVQLSIILNPPISQSRYLQACTRLSLRVSANRRQYAT